MKGACCKKNKRKIQTQGLGFFTALMVALVPKCPLCIMAYSSAITLCSGKTVFDSEPTISSYLSIVLALSVVIFLLLNYKRNKTPLAILFAGTGIVCLFLSEWIIGEVAIYYIGTALLFFGVWYNASFLYFFNKIKKSKSNKNNWSAIADQHTIIN